MSEPRTRTSEDFLLYAIKCQEDEIKRLRESTSWHYEQIGRNTERITDCEVEAKAADEALAHLRAVTA